VKIVLDTVRTVAYITPMKSTPIVAPGAETRTVSSIGESPTPPQIVAHACAACGGSGREETCGDPRCPSCFELDACPVCLGVGSIPDQAPVADALADAETLRLGWWGNPEAPFVHEPFCAADHGAQAATKIAMGWDDEASIVWHAKAAARAAFRAVPALREAK
jgi:hypothetical protein